MKLFLFLICFPILVCGSAPLFAQGTALQAATLPDAPLPQVLSAKAAAPQSTPSTSSQTPADASQSHQANSAAQVKAEEKQRLLGIVPAFNTVQSGDAPPLTKGQKFDLWFHSSIDPFTFAVAGIDAGIEQAENSYPEYGQGAAGFGKRYGAAYADSVDGNFWGNAVLPSLLHQDPRYFRLGHGPLKKRLWYAVISTVRCKGDNGKWQPSYSNVGGNLIGGAISNVYYPASDRGVGLTLERGFTVTAEGAIGSIAYEFYPDAIAYLKRRHQRNTGTPLPAMPVPTPAPQP